MNKGARLAIIITYDRYQSGSDIILCEKEDRLEMMSDAISASSESLREHSNLVECPGCALCPGIYTPNVRLK
jgi:hypothetical protein